MDKCFKRSQKQKRKSPKNPEKSEHFGAAFGTAKRQVIWKSPKVEKFFGGMKDLLSDHHRKKRKEGYRFDRLV